MVSFLGALLVFTMFYWVRILLPVQHHFDKLQILTMLPAESATPFDSLLELEKNQLALLELATSDSVYLVINLADSSLSLLIRGVTVYETKAIDMQKSALFDKVSPDLWKHSINTSQAQLASIEKYPIQFRKAPKDTLEAQKMALETENEKKEEEHPIALLDFSNDISVLVREHPDSVKFRSRKFRKVLHEMDKRKEMLKLWLELTLDQHDIRVIYRAIPTEANLLLQD